MTLRCAHLTRARKSLTIVCARRALATKATATNDPRFKDIGPVLKDDFAVIQEKYRPTKHPILLAHGLLGFDELHIAGPSLPGIQYWRGIREALAAKDIEVVTADVPASASIEERAEALARICREKIANKPINIIAHSMVRDDDKEVIKLALTDFTFYRGILLDPSISNLNLTKLYSGLDSRYMLSRLKPSNVNVLSLTTIATPHQGSAVADFIFRKIGATNIPRIYKVLEHFGLETGAFSQMTQDYMKNDFNVSTPNVDGIKYYSYGASFTPSLFSVFRQSHAILADAEGPNDGLVSVASSKWGDYKGTLVDVSHLDLINWTNRMRWFFWELTGNKRK